MTLVHVYMGLCDQQNVLRLRPPHHIFLVKNLILLSNEITEIVTAVSVFQYVSF